MEGLSKIILSNEKIKDMPLFFKTIYYNQVTDINEEMKLFNVDDILKNQTNHHTTFVNKTNMAR